MDPATNSHPELRSGRIHVIGPLRVLLVLSLIVVLLVDVICIYAGYLVAEEIGAVEYWETVHPCVALLLTITAILASRMRTPRSYLILSGLILVGLNWKAVLAGDLFGSSFWNVGALVNLVFFLAVIVVLIVSTMLWRYSSDRIAKST